MEANQQRGSRALKGKLGLSKMNPHQIDTHLSTVKLPVWAIHVTDQRMCSVFVVPQPEEHSLVLVLVLSAESWGG